MTKTCARCDRLGRSAYAFRKATPDTREQWRAAGVRRIEARGLCQPCYRTERLAGTLDQWERRNRDTADVAEDWHHLANPNVPVVQECRRLASQFGMDPEALERAVYRAGIRSRFLGGHGERHKAAHRTAA